jgi:hypothetical protein
MSSSVFYVTAVADGNVLSQPSEPGSDLVMETRGNRDVEQKWIVEPGDEPNTFALKHMATGKYMRASEVQAYAKVDTGDKQWWRVSSDRITPSGACCFSLVESPDLFLSWPGHYIEKGKPGDKLKVKPWQVSVYEIYDHKPPLTRRL